MANSTQLELRGLFENSRQIEIALVLDGPSKGFAQAIYERLVHDPCEQPV